MYNYGIRGKAYNLIKSYLSNRKQRVNLNSISSQFEEIYCGVPQGTILGPLFFIIYINDLLSTMPDNTILSFADDTAIISTGTTWNEVETKMNNQLEEVGTWLKLNKLSLNIDKTAYIEFGNQCNSTPKNLNITIHGDKINRVDNIKYLGVIFDSNMKWEQHLDNLYKKTKYLTFVFYKLSRTMPTEVLKILYYTLFHSIMIHGIIAWGGAYSGRKKSIQSLQTRLLKIVYKQKFIVDKHPLDIEQTFSYESLLYHYEKLSELYNNKIKRTRYNSLQIPKRSLQISIEYSYTRAISLYNRLPNGYKSLEKQIHRRLKLKK